MTEPRGRRGGTGPGNAVVRCVLVSLGVVMAGTVPAAAQLEVLLRGIDPVLPDAGRCARYRFTSQEPDGDRESEFVACVASVPDDGPVVLELTSGDSLQLRIVVGREVFTRTGARLGDHIQRVERTQDGTTEILTPEDWRRHPALAPAAALPVQADSSLGTRDLVLPHGDTLRVRGRYRHEARSLEAMLGEVQVTTTEDRRMDLWTAPEAPILGVVRAETTVTSERVFSEPIPGVPQRGPRRMRYTLELLQILPGGGH